MNVGMTAGIIGGVAAALIVLVIIIYCCCCRKKTEEQEYAMGSVSLKPLQTFTHTQFIATIKWRGQFMDHVPLMIQYRMFNLKTLGTNVGKVLSLDLETKQKFSCTLHVVALCRLLGLSPLH